MPKQGLIEYGKVGRPHGLKGELRFFPHNPESPVMSKLRQGRLVLQSTHLDVKIAQIRGSGENFVMRVVELRSRHAAAEWTNARLWVDESVFPKIEEEDTFYFWQLEGLEARTVDGDVVGVVLVVQNYGAGDLLIVRTPRGDLDIPFMDPWVGEVNLEEKFIVIDPSWLDAEPAPESE